MEQPLPLLYWLLAASMVPFLVGTAMFFAARRNLKKYPPTPPRPVRAPFIHVRIEADELAYYYTQMLKDEYVIHHVQYIPSRDLYDLLFRDDETIGGDR